MINNDCDFIYSVFYIKLVKSPYRFLIRDFGMKIKCIKHSVDYIYICIYRNIIYIYDSYILNSIKCIYVGSVYDAYIYI